MMEDVICRLKEFMENEARSCSMDFGCITPLYVYRMWNGDVPLDEIESAMAEIKLLRTTSLWGQAPRLSLKGQVF